MRAIIGPAVPICGCILALEHNLPTKNNGENIFLIQSILSYGKAADFNLKFDQFGTFNSSKGIDYVSSLPTISAKFHVRLTTPQCMTQ